MELFWNTTQITLGIILPFVITALVISLAYVAIGLLEYFKTLNELKAEKYKKTAPYDEVDTEYEVLTRKARVRFYKKGVLVWDGYIKEL